MSINETAQAAHENAKSKGFFDDEKNIGEMLCLIHSEVSEALECDRKGQFADWYKFATNPGTHAFEDEETKFKTAFQICIKDTFEDELADIMIRVMDLAAFKGIDLEAHIAAKMHYNSLRPHKHGKAY